MGIKIAPTVRFAMGFFLAAEFSELFRCHLPTRRFRCFPGRGCGRLRGQFLEPAKLDRCLRRCFDPRVPGCQQVALDFRLRESSPGWLAKLDGGNCEVGSRNYEVKSLQFAHEGLPQAEEAEEKFDFLLARDGFDAPHGALAARVFQGIGAQTRRMRPHICLTIYD